MKKFLILFLITLSMPLFAYRPTVESLFRNNNNIEIEKNGSYVLFDIKNLKTNETMKSKIYLVDYLNKREILQYHTFVTSNGTSSKVSTLKNILTTAWSKTKKSQALFYAVLNMFLKNDSTLIIDFLKKEGIDVTFNIEKIDANKKILLEKYKLYLERKKKNPDLSEEQSPLFGKNPEEKKEIHDLMTKSYYEEAEKAQLVKDGNEMFWKVLKEDFDAWFEASSRRLKKLNFNKNGAHISMSFQGYEIFNGSHEMPKYIYIQDGDDRYYIETKEYYTIDSKTSKYEETKINLTKTSSSFTPEKAPSFLIL
ncbi:MAG: hypothetical protein H6621_06995 [Halobacteriovoraceae bacterium]|nr:hypothetical protein [Halobacteriovoraceae bacterium]